MGKPEKEIKSLEGNPLTRLVKLLYTFGLVVLIFFGILVSYSYSQKQTNTYKNCLSVLKTIQRATLSRLQQPIPQQITREHIQEYRQLRGEGYPDTEILQYFSCQKRNQRISYETDYTAFAQYTLISVLAVVFLHVVISKSYSYVVKGR